MCMCMCLCACVCPRCRNLLIKDCAHMMRNNQTEAIVVHPEIMPSLAGLTGVGLDEAEPLGLEVARVIDYASRHLVGTQQEEPDFVLVFVAE